MSMPVFSAREVTQVVIVLAVVGLGLFDVIIGLLAGREATISCVLLDACQQHPIVAFALGVLCGHCLWPCR